MRLYSPLCKHNYLRWFRYQWKSQGNRRIVEQPIPKVLLEKGLKITDANKVVETIPILEKIEVPEPYKPPPALDTFHPKYKKRICHQYSNYTKLAEGSNQAQVLTKTVIHEGLPKQIENLVGIADQPNQDELVKRCILSSHIYDGSQVKLAKVIDQEKPHLNLPRVYGITPDRKVNMMLRNLLRLMETQTGTYEGALHRNVEVMPQCILMTEKDKDLLQFDVMATYMVTAKKPLQLFATRQEVAQENAKELPDLYPVKCTIDLKQHNIYDNFDFFPLHQECNHPHIHTLYFAHTTEDCWSKSQDVSKAITMCYAYAAAKAKSLYEDAKKLPEPIAVQCVLSNGPSFIMVAYQLNTVNLDESETTRNIAWIAPEMQLFNVCKEGFTKNDSGILQFEGYNPEVYRWLLALHMNGLNLSPPLSFGHLLPKENPVVRSHELQPTVET